MTYNWWDCSELIEKIEEDAALQAKAKDMCTELCRKAFSVTELVERLGPLLTSQNTSHRSRTMDLLSAILQNLPGNFLSGAQLKFVVAFYVDRTKDHHSVVPAILTGTLAMARMTHIPEDDFVTLFLTLIGGSVTCQSQTRSDRETFYEIIEHTCLAHTTKLTAVKDALLQGVIATLEGERDPRNLLRIFTFMPKVLELYPLEHWTEEMFEVFACYFPVDFYPPANVANPITRDQLAEKLLICLTTCKDFVEFCIPLAVEKLESQIKVSKMDSLQLLAKCATLHGAEAFADAFPNVWLSLKVELLPGVNEEVTAETLSTIRSILAAAEASESLTENLLNVILHSITISLCDTKLRLFTPACRIVTTCARSNSHAAACVANKLLPMFLSQLEDDTTDGQKTIILKFVTELVGISRESAVLTAVEAGTREKVQKIFVECLKQDKASQELAFKGLSELAELLEASEKEIVYQNLLQNLQDGIDVSMKATIERFAQCHEVELREKVVLKLLQNDFLQPTNARAVFRCIVSLVCVWPSSDILYRFLLDSIFTDSRTDVKLLALQSVEELLTNSKDATISQNFISTHAIIEQCIDFLRQSPVLPVEILTTTSQVLKLCTRTLNKDQQGDNLRRFLPDLAPHRGNELFLFDGLIAQLCPDVDISAHFHHITKDLIEHAVEISRGEISANSSVHLEVCDALLCSLFNRTVLDVVFEETLSQSVNYLNRQIEVNFLGVRTFAWILKGLLAKNHRKASSLIKDFTALLHIERLQEDVLVGFRVLAKSSEDINLPNIKPLYKQKLFELVLKSMTTQDKFSAHQLAALAEILLHLPMKVITINLQRIGAILFQCLECEKSDTLRITLTLINRLLCEESDFCRYHLQSLIPRCLQLSVCKQSLRVRLTALEFLLTVTKKYDTVLLLPFKQDVIFGLQPVLDDHKRIVRTAAVKARAAWFVFDASKS
ncbi:MMS19 nucleotide excision repair protein [Phlebotomus argentipes]|uniref:MMS19 nucleotide excision repair protein n=1 Tax=Phlebotomus argentipes TaxID=94469 RepID=UPI002893577B|nr:MMS19 nucleotide excision repair protein [Phlebotomus argentipes]